MSGGKGVFQVITVGDAVAFEVEALVGDIILGQNLGGDSQRVAFAKLIGEGPVNVSSAVSQVTLKVQGEIFRRLEDIRLAGAGFAPAAGSTDALNRVWVSAFASRSKQKDTEGYFGYKFNSAGFALGYDRHVESVEGLTLGLSAAFSSGKLKSNSGLSNIDVDTMGIGLYGSYALSNGAFFDALFAYGWTANKSEVNVMGDQYTGDFNGNTFQAALRGGVALKAGQFLITPSLGVRFFNYSQDGYAENSHGTVRPHVYDKYSDSLVDIPLQIKFNTSIETGSAVITPEVRLGWTYVADRPDNNLSVGFTGSPVRWNLSGIEPRRSSFQGGLGLKVETAGFFDFTLNYDADVSKKFSEHRLTLELGFSY